MIPRSENETLATGPRLDVTHVGLERRSVTSESLHVLIASAGNSIAKDMGPSLLAGSSSQPRRTKRLSHYSQSLYTMGHKALLAIIRIMPKSTDDHTHNGAEYHHMNMISRKRPLQSIRGKSTIRLVFGRNSPAGRQQSPSSIPQDCRRPTSRLCHPYIPTRTALRHLCRRLRRRPHTWTHGQAIIPPMLSARLLVPEVFQAHKIATQLQAPSGLLSWPLHTTLTPRSRRKRRCFSVSRFCISSTRS